MRKVLVIDDHHQTHRLLQPHLKRHGLQVIGAADGSEGLARARAEAPALILLDITMPGRGGLQVLDELKANAATRDIPVIMLTAQNREEEAAAARRGGAAEYVCKPFHPAEVSALVKRLLDGPPAPEEER